MMFRAMAASLSLALALFAPVPAAQAQTPLKKVTLVSSTVNPPSITNIYYLAAMEGAFKEHGLEVLLQQSSGSPSSVAAIISAKADFGSVAVTTLANAVAEGVKAKMVVTGNFDFPGMILAQPSIKSIKDLEGKRMGASAIGSMEYAIAQAYLVKQGVDFSKITWVATRQTSNTVQALAAAQIDAAWMNTPAALPALKMAPQLKILVDATTIAAASPNPGGAVVVTERFAQQSPDTVQAFVDAVIEANRALYKDRAFFDRVVDTYFPGISSAVQRDLLYEAHRASWGVNGGLPLGVMESALDNWKKNINPDKAKNPFFSKAEDLMDLRFARKSLERLGKFEGALDVAEWADVKR